MAEAREYQLVQTPLRPGYSGSTRLNPMKFVSEGITLGAFAPTTSAALAGVITDETGTGSLVFATSPTFTTPDLGPDILAFAAAHG